MELVTTMCYAWTHGCDIEHIIDIIIFILFAEMF